MLRQGYDLTRGFRRFTSFLKKPGSAPYKPVKRKVTMEVRHKAGARKSETLVRMPPSIGDQERLDAILEKIKKSGMDSLSPDEKQFLDDASQR
jgi:hypothetical protein